MGAGGQQPTGEEPVSRRWLPLGAAAHPPFCSAFPALLRPCPEPPPTTKPSAAESSASASPHPQPHSLAAAALARRRRRSHLLTPPLRSRAHPLTPLLRHHEPADAAASHAGVHHFASSTTTAGTSPRKAPPLR
uniref:Uncharacterized protein n=1 Tax=Oryza sativa subsp. japonica TaxID=39947 RepID=Q69QC0_ORYSJ|nr:hypothetical protein [Oryza sativa Japonica Group]